MSIAKDRLLKEMDGGPGYECPVCGDAFRCVDKEDLEHYEKMGHCDHCEHIFTKDD